MLSPGTAENTRCCQASLHTSSLTQLLHCCDSPSSLGGPSRRCAAARATPLAASCIEREMTPCFISSASPSSRSDRIGSETLSRWERVRGSGRGGGFEKVEEHRAMRRVREQPTHRPQ